MTKAKISEYDAVASNNTDVNGVNIAEGCPPSGMNNMGREIMAALKRFQVGSDGDGVTVGGNLVVSGSSTVNTFTAGPVSATTLNTSGAVVFNDAGADVDFRVEGDTDANLLFVDASADAVGVGTNSAGGKLTVQSDGSSINALRIEDSRAFSASPASSVVFRQKYNTAGNFAAEAYIAGGKENATDGNQLGYLAFGTNNNSTVVERMRIDSSGNVGIGVTPSATASGTTSFEVKAVGSGFVSFGSVDTVVTSGAYYSSTGWKYAVSGSPVSTYYQAEGTHRWFTAPSGTAGNAITFTQAMTLDASGNLLVGQTTSVGVRVQIGGFNDGSYASSSGLGVVGNSHFQNGLRIGALAGAGSRTVTADSNGTLSASSDSSLKQEVDAPIAGLAEIMQVKPKAYKWLSDIEDRGDNAAIEIGFFADQVAPLIPSAAPMGNDGKFGFYDRSMIAAMVKAIQELKAELDTVKAELATLKG